MAVLMICPTSCLIHLCSYLSVLVLRSVLLKMRGHQFTVSLCSAADLRSSVVFGLLVLDIFGDNSIIYPVLEMKFVGVTFFIT